MFVTSHVFYVQINIFRFIGNSFTELYWLFRFIGTNFQLSFSERLWTECAGTNKPRSITNNLVVQEHPYRITQQRKLPSYLWKHYKRLSLSFIFPRIISTGIQIRCFIDSFRSSTPWKRYFENLHLILMHSGALRGCSTFYFKLDWGEFKKLIKIKFTVVAIVFNLWNNRCTCELQL